jgi:uncharacterized integral membrane protein
VLAIQLILLLSENPFYSFINAGCLTVTAICLAALIQRARGEISSYHLSLAHHITLTMLPAILGVAAKGLWITQRQSDGTHYSAEHNWERRDTVPWGTILLCCICFCLIFGIMFSVLLLQNRCSFNGSYLMGPSDLPTIVWVGLGIYLLGWIMFMLLSIPRYRVKRWSLRTRRVLAVICQLAVLAATAGLIYYVEYNVQFAQMLVGMKIVGDSDKSWR